MQTRPAGTSGKGLTERHHKPPHASEPEQKPRKPPQHTEQLSVVEIHQESLRVQMHRKTTVSELHKKRIQAPNTLTTRVLLDSQQQCPRFRYTAECKPAPQALPERVSPNGTTNHPMHLNLNKNHKYRHNTLSNFHLQRFTKNSTAFRCSEKQEHLNSTKMWIQAPNTLTTSALQEFQQQCTRFRCSVGMKHRRVQTSPAGISGKGLPERHHKPPHASEPEQKPQTPLQRTE